MAQIEEHATCPRCGKTLSGPTEACAECDNGDAPVFTNRSHSRGNGEDTSPRVTREALRLTPAQLQATPRVVALGPPTGPWGRPGEDHERTGLAPALDAKETKEGKDDRRDSEDAAGARDRPATLPPAPEPQPEPEDDSAQDDLDDEGGHDHQVVSLRPPVLASDALRRDLFPAQPGERSVRIVVSLLGLVGCAATVWLLGWVTASAPVLVAYAALTVLGSVPMNYMTRAVALVAFTALGLSASGLLRLEWLSGNARSFGLLAVVLILGTGLHYRAYHRASRLSRALVSLGICAGVAWLVGPGGLLDISVLDGEVRTWLPQVLEIPLGLLLMVSLLAFMDGRTTGGCATWATCLWLWFAVYGVAEVLAYAEAPSSWLAALVEQPIQSLLATAAALLSPAFGLSAAQALSGALAQGGVTSEAEHRRIRERAADW